MKEYAIHWNGNYDVNESSFFGIKFFVFKIMTTLQIYYVDLLGYIADLCDGIVPILKAEPYPYIEVSSPLCVLGMLCSLLKKSYTQIITDCLRDNYRFQS